MYTRIELIRMFIVKLQMSICSCGDSDKHFVVSCILIIYRFQLMMRGMTTCEFMYLSGM